MTEINEAAPTVAEKETTPEYADFRSAYRSVNPTDRRRGYTMLVAAGITLAFLMFSRIFWLFKKPLYDLVYYGTISEVLYYIVVGVFTAGFSVALWHYVKKLTGVNIYAMHKRQITITQALAVIAIGAVAVFIAGATLKFKLKIELEMGAGVSIADALVNISVYFYYMFHIWLGLSAAALVRKAMALLLPNTRYVPWDAIFIVAVFGVIELVLELYGTTHMYPWMYFLFTFAYAAIYAVSDGRFYITFIASVIIMVL